MLCEDNFFEKGLSSTNMQIDLVSRIQLLVLFFFFFKKYRSLCTAHLYTELIGNYITWVLISEIRHFLQYTKWWIDCILKSFLLVLYWMQRRQGEAGGEQPSLLQNNLSTFATTAVTDVLSQGLSLIVFPVLEHLYCKFIYWFML